MAGKQGRKGNSEGSIRQQGTSPARPVSSDRGSWCVLRARGGYLPNSVWKTKGDGCVQYYLKQTRVNGAVYRMKLEVRVWRTNNISICS
jgi:hypothetical protein